jgi:hypothetical protein
MHNDERTPLIVAAPVRLRQQRYQTSLLKRRFIAALSSILLGTFLYILRLSLDQSLTADPSPILDTQVCYSSFNTSTAYASAEALNNNIDEFCRDAMNNVPFFTAGWRHSRTYYANTPDEYTMTVDISNRAFSFDRNQCTNAMSSIINGCDISVEGSNPMNWKQGGKRVQGKYAYQIDIFRQNRPWPPPAKPRQSCVGWYKFILQHYDIYGAGWANYDWGQKSLRLAINPCCGLGASKSEASKRMILLVSGRLLFNANSNIGSLTGWHFEYFHQPDENGYEVRELPLLPCQFHSTNVR